MNCAQNDKDAISTNKYLESSSLTKITNLTYIISFKDKLDNVLTMNLNDHATLQ